MCISLETPPSAIFFVHTNTGGTLRGIQYIYCSQLLQIVHLMYSNHFSL